MIANACKETIGLVRKSPSEKLAERRQRQCGPLELNRLLSALDQTLPGGLAEHSSPRGVMLDFTVPVRAISAMQGVLAKLKETGVEGEIAWDGRVRLNKTQLAERFARFYFTDATATAEECATAFPHGLRTREALKEILSLLSCDRCLG